MAKVKITRPFGDLISSNIRLEVGSMWIRSDQEDEAVAFGWRVTRRIDNLIVVTREAKDRPTSVDPDSLRDFESLNGPPIVPLSENGVDDEAGE